MSEARNKATDAAIEAHAKLIVQSAEILSSEQGEIYYLRPIKGFEIDVAPDAEPLTFLDFSVQDRAPNVEPIKTMYLTITPEMWERFWSDT